MKRILLIGLPFLLFLVIVGIVALQGKSVEQPLRYNHKKHIEDAGLTCTDCHQYVETLAVAGIPGIKTCGECHEEALTESSDEAILVKHIADGTEIGWQRLYTMRPDVYFSHRRHVAVGKIPCEQCHGNVSELSSPPKRPLVNLSMDYCMDCHDRMQVVNDCIACHK